MVRSSGWLRTADLEFLMYGYCIIIILEMQIMSPSTEKYRAVHFLIHGKIECRALRVCNFGFVPRIGYTDFGSQKEYIHCSEDFWLGQALVSRGLVWIQP